MIVMKVDRQNYWQALQLLLLHFFFIQVQVYLVRYIYQARKQDNVKAHR